MNKFKTTLIILGSISSAFSMESSWERGLAHSYSPCAYLPTHIQNMEETADDLAYRIQDEFNKKSGNTLKRHFRERMEGKYQTYVNGNRTEVTYGDWNALLERWEQSTMEAIGIFVNKLQTYLDDYALDYKEHPAFETMMLENKLSIEHNFYETLSIRN